MAPLDDSAAASAAQPAPAGADLAPHELDADDQTLLSAPVQWSEDLVKAIHKAVHEETMRTVVGAQFLPHSRVAAKTTSIRPDLVLPTNLETNGGGATPYGGLPPPLGQPGIFTLLIDEGATIRLNEIWVEFALTDQQVSEIRDAQAVEYSSVLTLARRSAQYLALAQDYIIHQGEVAYMSPFFASYVRWRPGQLPNDGGLLNLTLTPTLPATPSAATPPLPYTPFFGPSGATPTTISVNSQTNSTNPFFPPNGAAPNPAIIVNPLSYTNPSPPAGVIYGENTFAAVAQGVATLTALGKSGPFALVVHTVPFADTFAPVGLESLAITADRITPLLKAGFYSSGSLAANPPATSAAAATAAANAIIWNNWLAAGAPAGLVPDQAANPYPAGAYTGVLVSVGGCTAEMVVGLHARTRWQQKDANGNHRFRVLHRFALKLSDPSAVIPLVFMPDSVLTPI